MVVVPVTLATAASSALLNIWLGSRVAALRKEFRISVGDGGHEPLLWHHHRGARGLRR